jgi:hypothetical protein
MGNPLDPADGESVEKHGAHSEFVKWWLDVTTVDE